MTSKRNSRTRNNNARTGRAKGNTRKLTDIPRGERFDFSTQSIPLPPTSSQLLFHQYAPVEILTASTSGPLATTYSFTLNGLAGSATPAALFDMYKIEAIRMSVKPQNNAVGVVDPTVTKLVNFYWVLDYNDATPPTVASDMTTYENCMILSPGESGQRTFQPKPKVVVNSSSGTDYMTVPPQWMPCTSDDVPHYGVKLYAPVTLGSQPILQVWSVTFEYYIAFKHVS